MWKSWLWKQLSLLELNRGVIIIKDFEGLKRIMDE